ncbi:cytochrome P450 [Streptomyces sp. HMX87]|uniref:cytochrome P450 n=1 Tax=Streptomyces sp. HMX87 TaxID=3390849 RepID=UPI003A839C91
MAFTTGTAPGAFPVAGHAWSLVRRPLDFLESLPRYGDLVEVRLGPARAYVPCHPELLWRVLTDDRTFDKEGLFYRRIRATLGNSVGSCPYADHRRQRRLLQPAFHPARLERYSGVMEQEITALTERWCDGQVIDAFPALYGAALRTVMRSLFSTSADAGTVALIRSSVETVLDQTLKRLFVPPPLQQVPCPANRRFQRALRDLRHGVGTVVADYRAGGRDQGDLLSMLISARDEGAGHADDGATRLDDDEIRDQILIMFTAGAESVATNVCWALYLLARHPDAARRLRAEADAVLGGRPADGGDVPDLPYTARVVNEALRLYPPGWLFPRVTTAETELAGRRLPAGTTVLFSAPVVHRQAALYERPEVFEPDRWLPERVRTLPRGAFVPFGGGARKCIGDSYGMTESVLALAAIVGRWQVSLAPGTDSRPVAVSLALRPRRLLLRLTGRAAADGARPRPPQGPGARRSSS